MGSRGIDGGEGMTAALMFARRADLPAVHDQTIRKPEPPLLGEKLHKVLLDPGGINGVGEIEPDGKAPHVRIHGNPFDNAVRLAQDDIGRFSPDPRQLHYLLHRAGQLAPVALLNYSGACEDMPRLAPVKPDLLDCPFKLRLIGIHIIAQRPVLLKEPLRHLVDLLIRGLGRQDDGDKELPVALVTERYGDLGEETL